MIDIRHGDSLVVLPTLEAGSVESVVTDPPASISFMGKRWDHDRGGRDNWTRWLARVMTECLRCLIPGGYALVWSIPRRAHWTAFALEDAGFYIVDCVAHIFGSGFPKGQGQLKPAREDWWLCRKPGPRVLPLQIDACRVGTESTIRNQNEGPQWSGQFQGGERLNGSHSGRWPANLIHDGSPQVLEAFAAFGESSSKAAARGGTCPGPMGWGQPRSDGHIVKGHTDHGTAARFFYAAKASKAERGSGNNHPTVKPLSLISYLVRLITPPGGTVLDPFLGSGTTAVACIAEGRSCIGIERDEGYVTIARRRVEEALAKEREQTPLFAAEEHS